MNFKANPHYSPEACGLKQLFDQDNGGSYEFDMFLLFLDVATGKFYAAKDSGCSCPTPFEDVRGLEDMTPVETWTDLKRIYLEWNNNRGGTDRLADLESAFYADSTSN
jgi:hypothetical protein